MSDEDCGATVRAWTDVIRRARLDALMTSGHKGRFIKGSTHKLVALTVASYSDANGQRVFPGIARVAADAEITYNVAERCIAGLRELGLIQLVRRAVRRAARSERERTDEYRLTLPPDLLEKISLPTPSDYLKVIARIARPHRSPAQTVVEPAGLSPSQRGLDTGPTEVSTTVTDMQTAVSTTVTGTDLPPSQCAAKVSRTLATSTTSHPERNLGFEAAAPHASEAESENPNFDDAVTGPPSLHVVTGSARGTPALQRGLWPAPVPALMPTPTAGEIAIANVRRLLSDRKRGRATA